MKFLSISIIFATIIAMGVFFLEPLTRGYHEEMLKHKALKALNKHYMGSEVEVDHLHATRIVVYKTTSRDLTEQEIKQHVSSIVRNVPGIYAGEDVVEVRPELVLLDLEVDRRKADALSGKKPIKGAVVADGSKPVNGGDNSQDSSGKVSQPQPGPNTNPEPLKPVKVKKESEKRPASLVISWAPQKKSIAVAGELSSEKDKEFISEMLGEKYPESKLMNTVKVLPNDVRKLKLLNRLIPSIPNIIKYSHGKGSLVALDEPGRLEVNGEVYNKSLHQQISRKLVSLAGNTFKLENRLKYISTFSVVKDSSTKTLTLKGTSNSQNSNILVSRVRKIAGNLEGYTANVDGMKVDKNCLEFEWDKRKQVLMESHLEQADSGKLVYRGNKPTEIYLTTSNPKYQKALEMALKDAKDIKSEIKYVPAPLPKPVVPAKNVEPKEPKEPKATPADAVATQELKNKLKGFRIYFKSGSDYVGKEHNAKLKEVAEFIKSSKDKKSMLTIGGYADKTGNAAYNKSLSLKRARAVQIKLVALGVPAARIQIEFFGAESSENQQESRRVEIHIK